MRAEYHVPAEGELRPVRVLLLLSSLHGGGAERVAVHLQNHCDPRRIEVKIGLLREAGPFLADADRSRVIAAPGGGAQFVFEGHNSGFYRPAKLAAGARAPRAVRRMIRDQQPDVVMSFLKGMSLITYAALRGMRPEERPRWIAREGNNTHAVIDDELGSRLARSAIKRLTAHAYRQADGFLANSQDMADTLQESLRLDPARVRVAYNPIDLEAIATRSRAALADPPARPFIVAAGRLEHQKGHDLLLRAFAASRAAAGMDLVILGRGSLEAPLRALAAELGVAERVRFQGFTANPWAWFARARLFVLASRWEGYPNALMEAMATGAPTLVTDCDFGPREAVEGGRSGLVVRHDSAEALREGLDALLDDPALREGLASAGLARSRSFGLEAALDVYSALFEEQVAARRSAQPARNAPGRPWPRLVVSTSTPAITPAMTRDEAMRPSASPPSNPGLVSLSPRVAPSGRVST